MKSNEIMTSACKTGRPDETLRGVATLMAAQDIGSVPVADDDRLVGMITDRDIVLRGIADGRDIDSTRAGDILSGEVDYCFDDQDTDEVAANMGELQVRRMPVVDRDKKLVGVVSLGDLSSRGAQDAAGAALTEVSSPR